MAPSLSSIRVGESRGAIRQLFLWHGRIVGILAASILGCFSCSSQGTGTSPFPEGWQQQWPAFRGPNGDGVCTFAGIPQAWDEKAGTGILWKVTLPLPGHSCPSRCRRPDRRSGRRGGTGSPPIRRPGLRTYWDHRRSRPTNRQAGFPLRFRDQCQRVPGTRACLAIMSPLGVGSPYGEFPFQFRRQACLEIPVVLVPRR